MFESCCPDDRPPRHALCARLSCRCGKDEFNPRAQLFFTPLVQAMRLMIHLGETVPDGADELAYHISAGKALTHNPDHPWVCADSALHMAMRTKMLCRLGGHWMSSHPWKRCQIIKYLCSTCEEMKSSRS